MKPLFSPSRAWRLFLLLALALLPWEGRLGTAQAPEVTELRQRVSARAPVIARLKSAGLVREGSHGLLEMTTQLTESDTQAVQAENRDRSSAFSLLATKNNLPISKVTSLFVSGARNSAPPPPSAGATPTPALPSATPSSSPTPEGSPIPAASPSPVAQPAPFSTPAPAASPLPLAVPPPPEGLPAKVLNRPAATLHEQASSSSTRLRENLPGFLVFYVVGESGGWLQVSASEGGPALGWLAAEEVIPWRHNLAVRFAHEGRGNRLPVPFFQNSRAVETALRQDEASRKALLESASGVPNTQAAEAAGVVAVQPRLVDRKQFYILPILEHRTLLPREFSALRGEARLLRVAALKQILPASSQPTPAPGRPALDVVFIMDLSSSMQPFVNETLGAIENLSEKLSAPSLSSSVRFGFWGYRDRSPDQDFGGGQVTKNFTPQLQDRADFLQTLRGVRVSTDPAGDYAEAVFYGVRDALENTAWTPGAMRVLILIGDASSHPPGHPKNPQNLSAETLRSLANAGERPAYILPIYILRDSPLAPEDARVARPQFRELGRNPNVAAEGLLLEIEQGNSAAEFGSAIRGTLAQLVDRLQGAADFETQKLAASPPASPIAPSTPTAMADSIFAGAYLDWLAGQTPAGEAVADSLTGWAADKDLLAPDVQALDVVFLITKSQLDTLVRLLNSVVDAGVRARVRGTDFFSSLQSVVGRAAVDPAQLGATGGAALLPDFLKVLPYQSELLTLTPDEWRSLSASDQTAFLDRLNSNIHFYTDLARDPSKWVPLNPEDDREARVTAVPLDRLP